VKSTAAAEVWDAGVLKAPVWALGSGAASLLAMPLQLQLRLVSQLLLLSPWEWASALVFLPRLPQPKYRPGPNHIRYLVDPHRRTEWKRCGQPSY
jgi:hypothetical protein